MRLLLLLIPSRSDSASLLLLVHLELDDPIRVSVVLARGKRVEEPEWERWRDG